MASAQILPFLWFSLSSVSRIHTVILFTTVVWKIFLEKLCDVVSIWEPRIISYYLVTKLLFAPNGWHHIKQSTTMTRFTIKPRNSNSQFHGDFLHFKKSEFAFILLLRVIRVKDQKSFLNKFGMVVNYISNAGKSQHTVVVSVISLIYTFTFIWTLTDWLCNMCCLPGKCANWNCFFPVKAMFWE